MIPSSLDTYHIMEVSDNRRPIYGVLTEPLRANMRSNKKHGENINVNSEDNEQYSYIPKAHI